MITPVFSSRRAERFAQLLDHATGDHRHLATPASGGEATPTARGELGNLMAISQQVSALPLVVEVDPEFRSGLRASLMARIEREGIGATAAAPEVDEPRRRRLSALLPSTRTRGAIIVSLAAGTLAVSGVSAASGDAIPGDALYGVKRSTERAQLAFAGSDVSRGQLHLEFAKARLAEALALGNDKSRLDQVLDDLDDDMRQGSQLLTTAAIERGEAAGLQVIEQFVGQQRPQLVTLSNRLNGAAKARANDSLALIDRIDNRAEGLREMTNCPSREVGVDELGVVPLFCGQSSPQQSAMPTDATPESSPRRANPVTPNQTQEPADVIPSVEADSPSAAPVPTKSADPDEEHEGGIIENLWENIFGG